MAKIIVDRNNIDRSKWLKYIKLYEEFNKEIPEELKNIFNKVRIELGKPLKSFIQIIDLNEYGFKDIKIKVIVEFEKILPTLPYGDRKTIYGSNINVNDLLSNKSIIDIPINIIDVSIDIDKLSSVVSHEIRHIYDFCNANDKSDMESFINVLRLNRLKENRKNYEFLNFLDLVYLSLEHELIARNTMIYENFVNCICSEEELIELFKDTYVYESLIILDTFDSNKIEYTDELLNDTNDFIKYFAGDLCNNEKDIIIFYQNWEKYFKMKSNEYMKEAYKVLDNLYNAIKESYDYKKDMTVKELLLDIYNKYIKK